MVGNVILYNNINGNRMEIINGIFPENTTDERVGDFIRVNFPNLVLGIGR